MCKNSEGNSSTDTVYVAVVDGTPPVLTHPNDLTYSEDSTGHTISWQGTENYPSHYEVFKNGSIYRSGPWNSSSEVISVSVDGLTQGAFLFVIVVYDIAGNSAMDTVVVRVLEPPTTTTTTEPGDVMTVIYFIITIGSFVVIVVFVILIMRARK